MRAIVMLTLFEARRRRIVQAAVVCGLAFLAVFGAGMFFAARQLAKSPDTTFLERQGVIVFMTILGLWVVNWLSMAAAVLLSVDTMSGEIASGVIETLVSKPIRRSEI